MSAIGNFLWFIFGGLWLGLAWWGAGLLCALTIIGLPWTRSCFVIGQFIFLPFGKQTISRAELDGGEDLGTGALGTIGKVLWFVFAGFWLAVGQLAAALWCFVTIIGIPFGIQHLKLAVLALAPVGKTVVSIEVTDAVRLNAPQGYFQNRRS